MTLCASANGASLKVVRIRAPACYHPAQPTRYSTDGALRNSWLDRRRDAGVAGQRQPWLSRRLSQGGHPGGKAQALRAGNQCASCGLFRVDRLQTANQEGGALARQQLLGGGLVGAVLLSLFRFAFFRCRTIFGSDRFWI